MNNSNTYLLLLKISFKRTVFSINVYRYIERREETDIYENKISLFRWRDEKIVNHFTEDLYSSPIGRGDIRNGRSHCETTRVSRISPGNWHDIQSGNYKTAVENHRHREHMSSRLPPLVDVLRRWHGSKRMHARTNQRARAYTNAPVHPPTMCTLVHFCPHTRLRASQVLNNLTCCRTRYYSDRRRDTTSRADLRLLSGKSSPQILPVSSIVGFES